MDYKGIILAVFRILVFDKIVKKAILTFDSKQTVKQYLRKIQEPTRMFWWGVAWEQQTGYNLSFTHQLSTQVNATGNKALRADIITYSGIKIHD